ncbi:tetratricopeptide repeat-containing glycosyltransferase family 2 protein [Propionispira raffinosivorans]|uniref:tetratricopeptide repeat-containing glycosyltransferase family 2 protein n=1 Tax=Propionispira raffinosivorans TaxID=86959 RepID=UPI00035C813F|nr:glycosyltransferase [Propionispira raffinosivorans]
MQISACVIVKNEAENISTCLESVQKIVQQIIVVDTGSTDNTVELAKTYGAEVYHYEWNNDFSAAKNFALGKAKGDWVIFLDADEYISAETAENVPHIIKQYGKDCDGFITHMSNIDIDDENRLIDEFFITRIFRRDPNLCFAGTVHEYLMHKNRKNRWYKIERSELELLHTGYSSGRVRSKCERNLKILHKQLANDPNNVDLYRYLADAYYGMDDYDQAIKYARQDLATGRKEISYASRSYRVLLNSLQRQGADFARQEEVIQESIKAFPLLPDFYAEYGVLFFNQGQYDKAEEAFNRAFDLDAVYDDMETSLFHSKVGLTYLVLGKLYEYKNDYAKAIEVYQKILADDKYLINAFSPLYQLICEEDPVYCIAFLNSIYDKNKKLDLEFLIANIQKLQRGKILAYYMQAYNKLVQEKNVDVLALLAAGNYSKIQILSAGQLQADQKFAVLSAMLIKDYKQIENPLPYFLSDYQKIIVRFYQAEAPMLSSKEFDAYQEILQQLFHVDEPLVLQQYTKLSMDFSLIERLAIAKILKNRGYYLSAVELYKNILSFELVNGKMEVLYELGYCYYRLQDYNLALQFLQEAQQIGMNNNEIDGFIIWSKEALGNKADQVVEV